MLTILDVLNVLPRLNIIWPFCSYDVLLVWSLFDLTSFCSYNLTSDTGITQNMGNFMLNMEKTARQTDRHGAIHGVEKYTSHHLFCD